MDGLQIELLVTRASQNLSATVGKSISTRLKSDGKEIVATKSFFRKNQGGIIMSMVINNNLDTVRTLNIYNRTGEALSDSMFKVSSGLKINSVQDAPSDWAISEGMRERIRALDQANQNAQNDNSMMKITDGALANTADVLNTLKQKAINAANDLNTDEDRQTIQKEFNQLIDQIDFNSTVKFNDQYLLDGSKNNATAATHSVFINQNLAADTDVSTQITNLKFRNGDSIGIQTSDYYQLSWVKNGNTFIERGQIGDMTLEGLISQSTSDNQTADLVISNTLDGYNNKFGEALAAPGGRSGIVIASANAGLSEQIAGFNIGITDANGNNKFLASSALDFNLLQRAQNNSGDQSLNFHIGGEANFSVNVGLENMSAEALGLKGTDGYLSVETKEKANTAINVLDNVLKTVIDQQTTIGAIEQRLGYAADNLTIQSENLQAADSTIRDADMAKSMTDYVKNNVQMQSAQFMLAQTNQYGASVANLLGIPE